MAIINETITKFSFIGSLKPQESFNKNLKASIGLLAGMATAVHGATIGFVAWTTSVTESIDPMVQLSRETDVSVAAIQELGYAASQNGSSLNAVQSSIRELTKRAGEFARTGGGPAAEAFLQLGLNVRDASGKMKTADRIMTDLSGSLQGFNKAEQADILDKLGIDPSMIQLLNQSSSAMTELREKARALGTITKDQADAAASLNDSNTTLKFGLQGLQNQIATGIAPVIEDITKGFIEFLIANKDLIKEGVTKLGKGLVALSGFISRMTPIVGGIAAAFVIWKVAALGVGIAMGTISAPIILITAAIAGVALAVDDLIVAFKGGDSVIQDFIMNWTGLDLGAGLRYAVEDVKVFISKAKSLFDDFKNYIVDIFSGITDYIPDFILGDKESKIGFQGGNNGAVDRGITNNSTSNANVNLNNNINVYSPDANAAGQAVYSYQTQQLRDTRNYFNRGGQ